MHLWRYFEVKFAAVLLGGIAAAWIISGYADESVPGSGIFAFLFVLLFPLTYLAGLVVGAYRKHTNNRSN